MTVIVALWCVAVLLGTAILATAVARRPYGRTFVYGVSLIASAAALIAAVTHLLTGGTLAPSVTLPVGLPWLGSHFRVDALTAFFQAVVNLGGGAASFYGLGYGRHEAAPQRVLPFFPAFLAGMNLVLLADDAFTFLLSWEFMSLASWALVMAHHGERDNARAGYVYLVMASFGTLVLVLAFGLMAGPDGGYGFGSIRAAAHAPGVAALVLVLMLGGAGSKAGLVPLHVWLPLAHPAAPSHVSALMSGVMTKVAIYGFVRVVFDLMGPSDWWWGVPVMAAGTVTAVLGILSATMERDIKRLLAFSTIENVGIIFVGLGLALAFQGNAMNLAAALALTAALLHVLNHTLFKSLLFFGAGAVQTATGERDLECLGGLIHRMPQTSFAFLVGCVAIAALPPLNGFVSEWLIFQAILQSPQFPQWGLKIMAPAVGALLAMSAALAAACFVRLFGIAFLGRPRSAAAAAAQEVDLPSRSIMIALAGLCLLAGVLPGLAIDSLAGVTQSMVGAKLSEQATIAWLSVVPIGESRSTYNGLLVFLFIAASTAVSALVIYRLGPRTIRRAPAWDCGFPDPSPATQYTAGSFAQPLRRVFGGLAFGASERVDMPAPGDTRAARLTVTMHDRFWEWLYTPLTQVVSLVSGTLNHLQFLTIRRYLTLVFIALVALLLVLALWP